MRDRRGLPGPTHCPWCEQTIVGETRTECPGLTDLRRNQCQNIPGCRSITRAARSPSVGHTTTDTKPKIRTCHQKGTSYLFVKIIVVRIGTAKSRVNSQDFGPDRPLTLVTPKNSLTVVHLVMLPCLQHTREATASGKGDDRGPAASNRHQRFGGVHFNHQLRCTFGAYSCDSCFQRAEAALSQRMKGSMGSHTNPVSPWP